MKRIAAAAFGLASCLAASSAVSAPTRAPSKTAQTAALSFDAPAERTIALVGGTVHVGDGTVMKDAVLEIRGARIVSVTAAAKASLPSTVERVDVSGKVVTPGLIAASSSLGLVEIDAEASTKDDARANEDLIRAAYDAAPAVNAASSLIPVAAVEGITTVAVTPSGGMFSGQVAWIDLVAGDHRTIVARPRVAQSAHLGQAYAQSRAATLAKMREVIDDARFFSDKKGAFDRRQTRDLVAHRLDLQALEPVVTGRIPLFVSAHRVSDILAAVQLARDYDLRIVVVGATQAWQVADVLADAKIPVVVQPSHNLPGGFDQIGARLDNAARLHAAGVEVSIATLGEAHNVRNVTQEAGIAVANGLDPAVAMRAITLNVARAYGMDTDYGSLQPGKVANVVVWDADPFELSNWPTKVYVRGVEVPMRTRQTELRDRYRKPGPRGR